MSEQTPVPSAVSPAMQVMNLVWPGAMAAQAVYLAAKLGLADLVANGPKTSEELAATKTHGPTLHRFLRALTSLGLFTEDSGSFRNTHLSDALRGDHPESIRPWAIMLGAPFFWKPMGELHQAITTGQPAFAQIFGEPFFHYLAGHTGDAAIFDAAMTAGSTSAIAPLLKAYDFSRFTRIVDVGGGQGALLEAILTANPNLHGVLYDLPGVVAGAHRLQTGNIAGRCEILGGDFLEGVPAEGDAYLLKGIIHDWDDDAAVQILKNCRRSIRPEGRLLLFEGVLKASSAPSHGLMDMLMLTLVGGRERTEPDYRALLRRAGFSLLRVMPAGGHDIVESSPAALD